MLCTVLAYMSTMMYLLSASVVSGQTTGRSPRELATLRLGAAALQRCRAGVLKGHVRSSSCEWRERRPARGDLAPAQGILRTADRGVKSLGSVGLATGGGSDRENAMQQLRTEVPVKELSEITIKTDT